MDEELVKVGLTSEVITADLESTLREFNIPLLSPEDKELEFNWQGGDSQCAILAIDINACTQPDMQGVAYSVIVKVQQMVTYGSQKPPIRCMATTWLHSDIGFVAEVSDTDSIREAIKTAVDEFILRYLNARAHHIAPDIKNITEQ